MGSLADNISSTVVTLSQRAATFGNAEVIMNRVSSMCHELHGLLPEHVREAGYVLQAANYIGRFGAFFGSLSTLTRHYSRLVEAIHSLFNLYQESGLSISGGNPEITIGQAEVNSNSGTEGTSDLGINGNVDDGRNNGKTNEQTHEMAALVTSSPLSTGNANPCSVEGSPSSDEIREKTLNLKRSSEQHACGSIIRKIVYSAADISAIENSSSDVIVIDVERNASLAAVLEINRHLEISSTDRIFRGKEFVSKLQEAARVKQELEFTKSQVRVKRKEVESLEAKVKQLEQLFPSNSTSDCLLVDERPPSKRSRF